MLLQLNEEQYLEVDPISPKTVTYDNVNEDTHNLSLNAMHRKYQFLSIGGKFTGTECGGHDSTVAIT